MAHSVQEKRKRLANVIDNEEVIFGQLRCYDIDHNPLITKELKNLLTNIYSTEVSLLDKADEDFQDAIDVYENVRKLIKQEKLRREKEKEIKRKKWLMLREK